MKPLKSYLRTGALAVGLLGVTAVPALAGASPAAAATAYGSGAAVQKNVQAAWLAAGHWSPPTGDSITYTGTTSLGGQLEFGLTGLGLDTTQDTSAPSGVLDGYVATDSAPTPNDITTADTAAGTGTQSLLSIPVAQVSEVIDLNIPSGITLNSGTSINLTNQLAEQLFAGTVPASSPYSANTWGALLQDSGLTAVASSPSSTQFVDDGGTNGGTKGISQELRANGAGATLTLKQYLSFVATSIKSTDWSSILIDENTSGTNEWPSGAVVANRDGSDSAQATAVAATGGLVGYGTLGAAISAGFVDTPGTAGTHTLIARLQDNGVATSGAKFANASASGASNVYSGGTINTSGTYNPGTQKGAGNWVVPNTSGTLNTTGAWATNGTTVSDYTHGWDTDVYDDAGKPFVAPYPLDIVLWDLSWDQPAWGTGNLKSPKYPTPTGTNSVEETVASSFKYVTGTGQADTTTPHFAPLPTGGTGLADIKADAAAIAAAL
jgi:hypothetical protein